MNIPGPQYDPEGLFIYAPSFVLSERLDESELLEGKALGTAKDADLKLMQHIGKQPGWHKEAFKKARKVGQTVGKRKLREVQARTRGKLMTLWNRYMSDKLTEAQFKKQMKATMKTAWRDVFLAGVRAGGVRGQGAGKGKTLVALQAEDEKWLKSAMQHETRFLNGMVMAIVEGTAKMPIPRRIEMYVDALTSFYESARVIALPDNVVIEWRGPGDKVTCPGCEYLFAQNPFTKYTLPTTPRAGMTPCLCLTNCRVEILTGRGILPWEAVEVGDRVLTHRDRWRRVTKKTVNRVQREHGFAVIVGEGGRLFGVTDDHAVWTDWGWMRARDAAREGVRVRRAVDEAKQDGAVSELFRQAAVARGVNPQGACRCKTEVASTLRGLDGGEFSQGLQRSVCSEILGRRHNSICVSVSVGVGEGKRTDSGGGPDSPQGPRQDERHAVELGIGAVGQGTPEVAPGSPCCAEGVDELSMVGGKDAVYLPDLRGGVRGAPSRGYANEMFLLEDLLGQGEGEDCDPAVRLLREEGYSQAVRGCQVEVGEVLLLAGVLPEGSPLYDLTVEDDNSFTTAGLVIHNTHCRDHLVIRRVTPSEAKQVAESHQYARTTHIKHLRKIKSKGHL